MAVACLPALKKNPTNLFFQVDRKDVGNHNKNIQRNPCAVTANSRTAFCPNFNYRTTIVRLKRSFISSTQTAQNNIVFYYHDIMLFLTLMINIDLVYIQALPFNTTTSYQKACISNN